MTLQSMTTQMILSGSMGVTGLFMMLGFIQIIGVIILAITVKETSHLSPQEKKEVYWPENEKKRRRQSSPIENPSSPSENVNSAAIAASTATRPEADLRPAASAIKPEGSAMQAAATSRMELPDMLNAIRRHLGMPNADPKDLIAEAERYDIDLSLCRTFRDKAQKLYDELR